jgi:hypothetical protein
MFMRPLHVPSYDYLICGGSWGCTIIPNGNLFTHTLAYSTESREAPASQDTHGILKDTMVWGNANDGKAKES